MSSVSPYQQLPIRSLDEARKEIDAKRSANHPNQPLQPFLQAPRRYLMRGLSLGVVRSLQADTPRSCTFAAPLPRAIRP